MLCIAFIIWSIKISIICISIGSRQITSLFVVFKSFRNPYIIQYDYFQINRKKKKTQTCPIYMLKFDDVKT